MLSPSDESLIERDPAVAGLQLLLDDATLLESLAPIAPWHGLTEARTEYLRYKPGVSCLARIQLQNATHQSSAYAVAYHCDARDKLDKAAALCDENGQRPIFLEKHSTVVYPFPLDRRLPAVARFATPSAINELLRRSAPRLLQGLSADDEIALTTLRYKPERRFVAKLTANGRPIAALKMYSEDSYNAAKRAAKIIGVCGMSHAFWAGHSDRHFALVFDWIDGEPLSELANDPATASEHFRRAARSLRSLHALSCEKLRKGHVSDGIRRVQESADVLTWIDTESADDVRTISKLISNRLISLEPTEGVPVHGDLHLKQFLVGDHGPKLIDFDRAHIGDPAEDLGSLYAQLVRHSINEPTSKNIESLFEPFLDEYASVGGQVSFRLVRLYAAIRLMELATEPFRTRHADWLAHSRRFVDAALEMLQKGSDKNLEPLSMSPRRQNGRAVSVDDPYGVANDACLPGSSESIEPLIAAGRLMEAARIDNQRIGFKLESIRILRHKPERRCLVEYVGRLKKEGAPVRILGKVHARPRHKQSFARQQAIWDAGFDMDCADGICVARPLGLIPEWHMWLQLGVPGQVSWDALKGPRAAEVGGRIAEAVHKLNCANIPAKYCHMLDDELGLLAERLPQVADELPELRQTLQEVLEACRERSRTIDFVQPVGIHHDFYPDQVLIDGERLYVVDHDWYALGDPRADIGNFVGHLVEESLRRAGHPHAYDAAAAAMIDRFLELNGAGESWRNAIDVYATLTLARHVFLSRRFPDRLETTHTLIDLLRDPDYSALPPAHSLPHR